MSWFSFFFGHVLVHWVVIALLVAGGIALVIEIPNRLGMALGAALITVAVGYTMYDAGFRAAHQAELVAELKAQIAQQAAIIEERDREARVASEMAMRQNERIAETETLNSTLQGKVDEYVARLAKDDPCVADDADVLGMRSIEAVGRPATKPALPSRKPR